MESASRQNLFAQRTRERRFLANAPSEEFEIYPQVDEINKDIERAIASDSVSAIRITKSNKYEFYVARFYNIPKFVANYFKIPLDREFVPENDYMEFSDLLYLLIRRLMPQTIYDYDSAVQYAQEVEHRTESVSANNNTPGSPKQVMPSILIPTSTFTYSKITLASEDSLNEEDKSVLRTFFEKIDRLFPKYERILNVLLKSFVAQKEFVIKKDASEPMYRTMRTVSKSFQNLTRNPSAKLSKESYDMYNVNAAIEYTKMILWFLNVSTPIIEMYKKYFQTNTILLCHTVINNCMMS